MRVQAGETDWMKNWPARLVAVLAAARLLMLISMPLEGLHGYGDFWHFYNLGRLPGLPFFDYWIEFPPVFAFLAELLARVAGEQEHVFAYLLFFILTAADCGSLYLFTRLVERLYSEDTGVNRLIRPVFYLLSLLVLAYNWWYFDPLAVFLMLLGITLIFKRRSLGAGLAIGAGILTKMFPALVLLAIWRRWTIRHAAILILSTLLPVALVWGVLWSLSPRFTQASLLSQATKSSWETVWALVDNNYITGNFGEDPTRLDPAATQVLMGNPPVVSPWLRLVVFGAIGLAAIWRIRPQNDRQSLGVLGFGWCLFLLWSSGWSPQWMLFLLPLVLLVLPGRTAVLFSLMLALVNLLEWPVLLSRGFFWALPLTIGIRTLLFLLLAVSFYQVMGEKGNAQT